MTELDRLLRTARRDVFVGAFVPREGGRLVLGARNRDWEASFLRYVLAADVDAEVEVDVFRVPYAT